MRYYTKEIVISVIVLVWFLFVATNVNQTLGLIYIGFTAGSMIMLTWEGRSSYITFQKEKGKTLSAILGAVGGYIALLITSVIVLRFIDPANANIASVINLMGAATPALAQSKWANLLTFGFAVASIETIFWGRLLEFFAERFHIDLRKSNVKFGLLILITILSVAFLFFHLTAKGITNISALVIVLIMMFISLIMVILYNGETRPAVYMHIFANTLASYLMLWAAGILQLGVIK